MLKWILILALVAIVAGALGFTRLSGAAATLAKILVVILIIGIILIALGIVVVA